MENDNHPSELEKETIPDESLNSIENRKIYDIPVEGSIGLLAMGAVGLKAWRTAKHKAKLNTPEPEKQDCEIEEQPEV